MVSSKLCKRCLIQLSYAIGIQEPLSIYVDSFGTGIVSDEELIKIIKLNFDLRPGAIALELDLLQARFSKTACYGHFGQEEFSWEKPKQLKFDWDETK